MSVRILSAQRALFLASFRAVEGGLVLKLLHKMGATSSPKAKVTRSNRVGCATPAHILQIRPRRRRRVHTAASANLRRPIRFLSALVREANGVTRGLPCLRQAN